MIRPDLCTSHTVLVVDVSGSMTTHDIALHRDRQIAAYSSLAMEYIAEQLFKQTARNSDIVSLVEFNRTSQVVLYREPFSWTLYNKLLNRRDSRSFARRERENIHDQIEDGPIPGSFLIEHSSKATVGWINIKGRDSKTASEFRVTIK